MPRQLAPESLTHAALIVNECQLAMTDPGAGHNEGLANEASARGIVERLAVLAEGFRSAGRPVVYTTIVPRADYAGFTANCVILGLLKKQGVVVEGSPAAELHPRLQLADGDFVSQRIHGLTPFHGTELEPTLRALGVDTVVVTGVSTNLGIPGACLEAVNRGFQVIVAEDCTAGAWPEAHEFQVRHTLPLLATMTTSEDLLALLSR
jgi:nicotinamidase-related amidase